MVYGYVIEINDYRSGSFEAFDYIYFDEKAK
jgi:hypothetical protein